MRRPARVPHAIEVGHIFHFGTFYSETTRGDVLDETATNSLCSEGATGSGRAGHGRHRRATPDERGIV
jgi:prolyl-tRNA synthetase